MSTLITNLVDYVHWHQFMPSYSHVLQAPISATFYLYKKGFVKVQIGLSTPNIAARNDQNHTK